MDQSPEKLLSLTFDDGPNDNIMLQIMELLNRYQAKATFFVVGNKITDRSAPILKLAVRQGFEIGNHSANHLHMSPMSREEQLTEVGAVQEQVARAAGIRPSLFRPPYLDYDQKMLSSISMPFISGIGNFDWEPDCSVEHRVELALNGARDGAFLLMHCFEGNEATVRALEILLPILRQEGFQLVTVSEMFRRKGISPKNGVVYENVGLPKIRDQEGEV